MLVPTRSTLHWTTRTTRLPPLATTWLGLHSTTFPITTDLAIRWAQLHYGLHPTNPHTPHWLLCHVLQIPLSLQALATTSKTKTPLTHTQWNHFTQLCSQRAKGVPLQYLLGEWEFRGLSFKVEPPVLIPRPETAQLLDNLLHQFHQKHKLHHPIRVLEVGVGSGVIGVCLAKALAGISYVGIDVNATAVSLTRRNALLHSVGGDFQVHQADVQHWQPAGKDDRFDLIISNPPYIPSASLATLQPEVRNFEDHRALDGGERGLDVILTILARAPSLLSRSRGWGEVWMEVHETHPPLLSEMFRKQPEKEKLTRGAETNTPGMYLSKWINDVFHKTRFCVFNMHDFGS